MDRGIVRMEEREDKGDGKGEEDISLVRFCAAERQARGNLKPPRGLYISSWKFCSGLNEVPRDASLALVARTIAPNGPLYNRPLV